MEKCSVTRMEKPISVWNTIRVESVRSGAVRTNALRCAADHNREQTAAWWFSLKSRSQPKGCFTAPKTVGCIGWRGGSHWDHWCACDDDPERSCAELDMAVFGGRGPSWYWAPTMPRPRTNLRSPSNRRSATSSLLW